MWTSIPLNLGACLLVAVGVMLAAFAIGSRLGRHRGVDQAWGLVFAAIALTSFALSAGAGAPWQRVVVTAATVVWGLRLSLHIHRRSRGEGEDRRYAELLSKATGSRGWYALTRVYLLQAAVAWFVSLPVQFAQYQPDPLPAMVIAGAALWALGFGFEAVGDAQLHRFRRDPASRGRVLDSGLWRYTRHPNYFGDACVWWGLYLTACGTPLGAATVLSPIAMTYFLAAKTGKPLMERHLGSSRPGYADYVRRTSGFVPLPPKR